MRASARSGFTMVDLMFGLLIVSVLLGSLAMMVGASSSASSAGVSRAELEARVHRALERIANELAEADRDEIAPNPTGPLGESSLTYRCATGWADGESTWGGWRRIELQLDPNETDDGTDEDGDGLVDEMRVVQVLDVGTPDERQVVLVNGVSELLGGEEPNGVDDNGNGLIDESGLCFQANGDAIVIRLTLQARDVERRTLTVTAETSVMARN